MFRWLSRAWWRASRDPEQLELWEILRRRGTRELAARNPQALIAAAERCRDCRNADECAQLIVGGRDAQIEVFCPNVMYYRHLGAMQRHAGKRSLTGT
jgi:hypothetical protein